MKKSFIILSVIILAGCAQHPVNQTSFGNDCDALLTTLDRKVDNAGVRNASHYRIPGFPHLRSNRFLAAFANQELTAEQQKMWLNLLLQHSVNDTLTEYANLPIHAKNLYRLATLKKTLQHCGDKYNEAILAKPEKMATLRNSVKPPDDYSGLQQNLGLYPVTKIGVKSGAEQWQADTQETFARPLAALPQQGQLRRYTLKDAAQLPATHVAKILKHASNNPLKIPLPGPENLTQLIQHFAPSFTVDLAEAYDQIGTINWQQAPAVDTTIPSVYVLPSYTRFNDQALLQLNYMVWFSERPKTHALDLLGGKFDGLIWRVTIDHDGEVLAYDSIHQCGCYHLFFPTFKLVKQDKVATREAALVPQLIHWRNPSQVDLRIESATHYLQRVMPPQPQSEPDEMPVQHYTLRPYATLHNLATGNPRQPYQSLFDEAGFVPGSERLERLLLWTTGVKSPGTMRQYGHHATAFFGRRHFDDADLFEVEFERVKSPVK